MKYVLCEKANKYGINDLKIPDEKIRKLLSCIISEKPEKSDVIVWLQGDRYDRGNKVLELFKNKFAPKILISGNDIRSGNPDEPDAFHDTKINEMKIFLLEAGVEEKNILADNQSLNTTSHPKNVLAFAKNNNWRKIILVSSPYHQLRVFLSFVKYLNENDLNVQIINQPAMDLAWDSVAGGKIKNMAELFAGELIKIEQYKKDVSTYEQGLKYINKL